MGTLANGNTPATEIAFDRVIEMIRTDEINYPNGAVFIAADLPDFGDAMSRALKKDAPIVVVYPNGSERIIPAPS